MPLFPGGIKMAKMVNLTPHTINIFDASGEMLVAIEPTKPAARCVAENKLQFRVNGIPMYRTSFGEVIDLPEPKPDTIYIVSLVVRQAMPKRLDLASPGELLRDADGKPIGCIGLAMSDRWEWGTNLSESSISW